MAKRPLAILSLLVWLGCSSENATTPGGPAPEEGGPLPDGGTSADGAVSPPPDGAPLLGPWNAGNPDAKCQTAIPAEGKPADISSPTTVVGTGTAASCTFSALDAAVTKGGIITFNCGSEPVAIAVTATMNLPSNKNTVIDGGRKVTLDGGGKVGMLRFSNGNFRSNDTRVTVQHIRFVNGKVAGSSPIPAAPAPCSQGFNAGEGGAIYMRDGNLSVIDSIFENNESAPVGPDVGGGAIRLLGSKQGVVIVGSTFKGNKASNGAAVGCLFSQLDVYDSYFDDNTATGHDANGNDPSKCSVINNGQNETGSGGNGGALYSDGAGLNVVICGDKIVNNKAGANAFGGGVFFTSNDFGGTLTIADTTISGNTGRYWTQVQSGTVTSAGTAFGTNAKSITIARSKLQGVP